MMHACMVGGVHDVCLWRWCMIHECMVCKFGSECMGASVYFVCCVGLRASTHFRFPLQFLIHAFVGASAFGSIRTLVSL
jgi:hypothetical protein